MKLFRWTDPAWAAAFLRGVEMPPVNLSNSFRFALDYGSVVCEFETGTEIRTKKEDIRDRSPDLLAYRSLFFPDSEIDGMEWDIGNGLSHLLLAPEAVRMVRIHYLAENAADAIADIVALNRAFLGISQKEFAKKAAGPLIADVRFLENEVADFEKASARPDVGDFHEYWKFLPIEQVVHTERAVITIPATDAQRESFWNRDDSPSVTGNGARHLVDNSGKR